MQLIATSVISSGGLVTETPSRRLLARDSLVRALATEAPRLLATARFLVRDESEAEDLVQQTLEIALRHADQLVDDSKLHAWLVTIETREAFRTRRRLARAIRFDGGPASATSTSGADEEFIDLRAAVQRLPTRIRAAVVLHHMMGWSIAQTASAMAISENSVKSELRVGLKKLREILNG
jgi:RNA polymerase sigma-70 factor, ECF subfamily